MRLRARTLLRLDDATSRARRRDSLETPGDEWQGSETSSESVDVVDDEAVVVLVVVVIVVVIVLVVVVVAVLVVREQ